MPNSDFYNKSTETFIDKDGRKYTHEGLIEGIKNHTVFGGGAFGDNINGDTSTWMGCVNEMGKWYQSMGAKYSNVAYIGPCPLLGNMMVRPDCSGFVSACISLFRGINRYETFHTATMIQGQLGFQIIINAGFHHRRLSMGEDRLMADKSQRWEILRCGDIVRHSTKGYGSMDSGHTYIIGPNQTRYEMGGLNNRTRPCQIPYPDYVDKKAATGVHHSYDIFRL